MDYEKSYKEALERAKILYNDKNEIGYANAESVLEEVFPLLKESDDEKTERILHSISSKISFHLRDIFTEEEFQCFDTWSNAWLEKQAEQKDIHLMELKAKAYDDAKERMSYAYNQNRVSIGFISEIFPNLSLYEKQAEQKPADKVEPKFKKE